MSWHGSALQVAGNALFDGPFNDLWPLVAAPALAALISDRTARQLPRAAAMSLPAALLAAAPGLAAIAVIVQAIDLGPVITWRGVVTHWITPLAAGALAVWALARACARQAEVGRLFAASTSPSDRLARAAARLGLRARQLASDEKECFVAGVLRPTVFVSRGALRRLNDEELEAALCHERAHVEGRDTAWLMTLSLLRDLAPFGRGVALEAFRAARETRADRCAAASAGPLSLAGALVALATPTAAVAAVLPMARGDSLRWRMQALLDGEAATASAPGRIWARTIAGVAASAALIAWPAIQWQMMMIFCDSVL